MQLRIDIPRWQDAAVTIVAAHLRLLIEARAAALGRALTPGDLEPGTWVRIMQGDISAIDYLAAQRVMLRAGQAVSALLERHDLLLTPASCIPPARLGVLDMSSPNVAERLTTGAATIAFSRLFNASGHPAAVLPWTLDADGLPLGVQLVASFAEEASLIRVAAMIEAIRPWAQRRPPEANLLQETIA